MENQYRSIYDLLQQLGVTANYTGYFHAAYAVQLRMKRPERLLLVTKGGGETVIPKDRVPLAEFQI